MWSVWVTPGVIALGETNSSDATAYKCHIFTEPFLHEPSPPPPITRGNRIIPPRALAGYPAESPPKSMIFA